MPVKKTPPDEINELATALTQTLDNAERGLRSFLASLQKSGLPEATSGYRQLQALLLQQRLWAINQQRAELNENFTRIAQLAGELHKIFHAYTEILKPLVELDNLAQMQISDESAVTTDAPEQPPESDNRNEAQQSDTTTNPQTPAWLSPDKAPARLLAVLIKHGACSPARAATLARLSQRKADKHLEKLAQAKIIERAGTHHNCGYRIALSFVQRNQSEPAD